MRVVFMGTPAFALPTLEALAASTAIELAAVYTRPDAASGRGKALRPTPVRQRAGQLGLAVRTPRTLRDADVQAELAALEPDAIVVAAYGCILPPEVLALPRLGCLNVHGSLLPRWRGAAPVQRAILAGDELAGVCVMQMEEGLDTGAYHVAGTVPVAGKTAAELSAQLAQLGARGMLEALPLIDAGEYEWHEQDESLATYAAKVRKDEVLLVPELSAEDALRRVRASSASAPARCMVCGRGVAVLAAGPAEDALAAGEVALGKKRIALGCADGAIELATVKPEGKREMPASAWAAGLQGCAQRGWNGVGGGRGA